MGVYLQRVTLRVPSGTHLVQNCDQLAFANGELPVLLDSIKIVQDPCLHSVAQNGHSEVGDGKRNRKEFTTRTGRNSTQKEFTRDIFFKPAKLNGKLRVLSVY